MNPRWLESRWVCFLGAAALSVIIAWISLQVRYRITERYLKITLFGICVRRIALLDIESFSKRRPRWAENWWCTWRPFRRILVIKRKNGWRRNLVLTPFQRYVFRYDLELAIDRLIAAEGGAPSSRRARTPDDEPD